MTRLPKNSRLTVSVPLLIATVLLAGACAAKAPTLAPVVRISQNDGTTKLVGEGRLSHAPEYIELHVRVQSQCFATPLAASEATDAAVAKVMKMAQATIDATNKKDGVFSRGGFTQPFSRYINRSLTLCEGTFQKTATVVIKSSRVSSFSARLTDLQRTVLAGSLRKLDNKRGDKPVTFATLSEPAPRLYYETRERLEQEALADALANARKKFQAAAKVACGNTKHRVARFVETSASSARPISYGRSSTASGSGSGAVAFDAIWINKLLDVYFDVDAGTCSVRS